MPEELRNPIYWPRPGDVLRTRDGVYYLVDFQDPFTTAFTRSDGEAGSYEYLDGWSSLMTRNAAVVIVLGSPRTWPWHGEWKDRMEHLAHSPSKEESLAYLRKVLSEAPDPTRVGTPSSFRTSSPESGAANNRTRQP